MIAALRRDQERLVFRSAALLALLLVLWPLLMPAVDLLGAGRGPEALGVLADPRPWALFAQTVGLAGAVTALALLIGLPLGFLSIKTDLPFGRALLFVHAFPLFLPPFLLGLGLFFLFGRQGAVGSDWTAGLLFSPAGAALTLALAFSPVVTCLVAMGLLGVDPALEEAARTVARPWKVAVRILLPLCGPAITLSGLVVFALAMAELGVPMFLRVGSYQSAVFSRLGGMAYEPGEAVALSLPLVGAAIGLLAAERRFLGRRSYATLGLRREGGSRYPLGPWRWPAGLAAWCAAALSLAPLAGLAWRAWPGGYASAGAWIGSAVAASVLGSAGAATLIVGLGLVFGFALARRRPFAGFFDALLFLGFMVPATVLAIGIVAAWNRPGLGALYASPAIVAVALAAHYGVVGVRAVAVQAVQTPPNLEEAARVAGASFFHRLAAIVLPLHARGMVIAWLLAFVFCLRDLETTVGIYPAGFETLPVRIFSLEANGPEPAVAALALLHVAVTAAAMGLGFVMLRAWKPKWTTR